MRNILSTLAAGTLLGLFLVTAVASGAQPWGELDRAMVATAGQDLQWSLSAGEVAVLAGPDGEMPSRVAESKGIIGRIIVSEDRFVIIEAGHGTVFIDFEDPAVAPVFRSGIRPDAPFLFPTGEVLAQFKFRATERQAASWADLYGLSLVRPMGIANTFLLKAANPSQSLEAASRASKSEQVNFCVPNWMRQSFLRGGDPLYPYQWHLKNTGEIKGTVSGNDMNVESVWPTYRGSAGQVIAIVDDGLEIGHKDLAPNVTPGLSWDFILQQPDPTAGMHGTCVGGVAAARGYNDVGVRGVAPEAGLCGYRILADGKTDAVEAEAETRAYDRVGIYNNSWGPDDYGFDLQGPGPLAQAAMAEGVTLGRGGKGVLYVWAGGNGLQYGDNSNYDGYANWRYTLAVGATNSAGRQSPYSESGANLCVNAPSNGGADTGIATADRTGPVGYNKVGEGQGDFADLDFTNSFGGTSSATPAVSGACALVLQANPELGWRDVKKILMTTASINDPTDTDWFTNGAGYHVNHKYGFGRVDVSAAVISAAAWTNLPPEVSTEGSASPGQPIPLGSQGALSTITLNRGLVLENVEVFFTSDHGNWGDLSIILTAPSGTTSTLSEKHDTLGSKTRYDNWRFGSVRYLGETSAGDWTLTVRDLGATGGGTFINWRLVAYGTDPDAGAVSLNTAAYPVGRGRVSPIGVTRLYQGVAAGITATAEPGYHFVEWIASPARNVTFGFSGKNSPDTTVALSGDAALVARFSETLPEMAVVNFMVYPRSGGLTDPGEPTSWNVGAGLAIAALPTPGYRFVEWAADPAGNVEFASAVATNTFARIKGDVTITAIFRAPDVKMTQGSVVQLPATDLDIPVFTRAPKVTGTTGKKSYATRVIGEFPSATVTAQWPGRPRIYDPAEYKNPVLGLGVFLEENPMHPLGLQSLVVDATKADGAEMDLAGVATCMVVPPAITSVNGELKEGSKLQLNGTFFGTKPPTVSIEYVKNGKYFTKACALIKEFYFEDALGRPSCMIPLSGQSAVDVQCPALPSGAEPTRYLILENPIGMCSFYMPR
jgi:kexin